MLAFSKYVRVNFMIDYYSDQQISSSHSVLRLERTHLKTKLGQDKNFKRREYRLLPWIAAILTGHSPLAQFTYVPNFHKMVDQFLCMMACLYPNPRFLSYLQDAGLDLRSIFDRPSEKQPITLLRLIRPEFALAISPILAVGVHESLAWLSETIGRNQGDELINLDWIRFCGRHDVARFLSKEKDGNLEEDTEINLHTHDISEQAEGIDDSDDLAYLMTGFAADIWPNDLRIREARRLLAVLTNDTINCTSVFIGRGMFTLFTKERRMFDKITLTASLGEKEYRWARFHQGAAVALAIAPSECSDSYVQHAFFRTNFMIDMESRGGGANVKLEEMTPERCGLLFGFGLAGLLSNISPAVIYNLLLVASGDIHYEAVPQTTNQIKTKNELCTVGILLAYAASLLDSTVESIHHTCNQLCLRTLLVHIGSCVEEAGNLQRGIEPVFEVNPICQMAALLGLGLLYAESNDSRAANILCDEIGNWPLLQTDSGYQLIEGQCAHSFSAAIALGFVHLGQGWNAKSSVIPLLRDYCNRCRNIRVPLWSLGHQINMGKRSNRSLLTGPAAAIALGLIFMGTDDREFAEAMLEKSSNNPRPDHYMFKAIAYWLIKMNTLEPTSTCYNECVESIETCVPCYGEIAVVFVIGIRFAGTRNWDLAKFLIGKCTGTIDTSESEKLSLSLVLSASLIMAGTGCLPILRLVRHLLRIYARRYRVCFVLNMALGLIMLGAGKLSFRQDLFAKACLVASMLPMYPSDVKDNRFCPQFMRHLYVLAVESRLLRFRSIAPECDGAEKSANKYSPLYCDVEIDVKGRNEPIRWARVRACHLPVLEDIRLIKLQSPLHWTVNIRIPDQLQELKQLLGAPPGHLGSLGYYTLERRELHPNGPQVLHGQTDLIPRTDKIPLPATISSFLNFVKVDNPNNLDCDLVTHMRFLFIYVRSRKRSLAFDYVDLIRYERAFEANFRNYVKTAMNQPDLKRKAAALERAFYIAYPLLVPTINSE
ncbi:hypothetical protein ACOME3_003914 [Neoechinorhynchus agilis]